MLQDHLKTITIFFLINMQLLWLWYSKKEKKVSSENWGSGSAVGRHHDLQQTTSVCTTSVWTTSVCTTSVWRTRLAPGSPPVEPQLQVFSFALVRFSSSLSSDLNSIVEFDRTDNFLISFTSSSSRKENTELFSRSNTFPPSFPPSCLFSFLFLLP